MEIIKENDQTSVDIACTFLKAGKIISFATDTVYGVAVDASNELAIEKLYQIKNRDKNKPIAIFVKNLEIAKKIFYFDDLATKLAKNLPGALTIILEKKSENILNLAPNLNQNGDKFLGFRIVEREFIKNLFNKFDGVLAVTSANILGQKDATTYQEVKKYFENLKLDLLIIGENPNEKIASTVIKIQNNKAEILRQGALKIEL